MKLIEFFSGVYMPTTQSKNNCGKIHDHYGASQALLHKAQNRSNPIYIHEMEHFRKESYSPAGNLNKEESACKINFYKDDFSVVTPPFNSDHQFSQELADKDLDNNFYTNLNLAAYREIEDKKCGK